MIGYAAGLVMISIFGHDIVVVPLLNWRKDRVAWHSVKYGVTAPLDPLEAGGIPRPAQGEEIRNVLRPQRTRNFWFIYGESGVGKTTLVRQAAHAVAYPTRERIPGTGFWSLVWDRVREVTGLDRWEGGGILYAQIPGEATSVLNRAVVGSALADSFRFDLRSYSWLEEFILPRGIANEDVPQGMTAYWHICVVGSG